MRIIYRKTVQIMLAHVDSYKFKRKPIEGDIGGIKSRFTDPRSIRNINVKQLAACFIAGRTVQPGVTPFSERSRAKGKSGTCAEDFSEQTIFMNDHDNKRKDVPIETPAYVAEVLARYRLPLAFAYPTFSSTPEHERFRVVLVSDEAFTDKAERDSVQRALIKLFPQSDPECKNADRIFFGTDKGLYEGIGDINAVCRKADLLAFAAAMGTDTPEPKEKKSALAEFGEPIQTGERHDKLLKFAAAALTKYGNETDYTYNLYMQRVEQCAEALPDNEVNTIWRDSCKYYETNTSKRSGYIPPAEYAAQDFKPKRKSRPISHYTMLSAAYMREHKYIVGVQALSTGGYGNDTVYEYCGGVWKPRSESDMKNALAKRVLSENILPDPEQTAKAYKVILMSGKRKDIETFNADENLVCFQNGVYRLSDGVTLPHSPDYYFTLQLNANIPETVQATPYCDLCLSNFGGTDVQNLLYEVSGAVLSNVYMPRFKKGVLQYGVGDSGKTQLKRLVEQIVGTGNYNNVDLSDLENNRFLSAAFQGVRLGGSNDMSNVRVKEQKIFKQLTGGDSIQAENKGEKSFTFRYKGLLWFLANQLPLFGGDKGQHVYDRWIVIHCMNSIPPEKQIKDIEEKMFQERDSFCIKALRAFQTAVANNYTFHVPEICRLANEEYRRKNSMVQTFVEECCEPVSQCKDLPRNTTGKVWRFFKQWCADSNSYTPGKAEFKRELAMIAGVEEADLVTHNKDGNFYPYAVTAQARAEIDSFLD